MHTKIYLRSMVLAVALSSTVGCYAALNKSTLPNCNPNQLSMHLIAVDYPGMSQSWSVYAIKNSGSHPCTLDRTPTVYAVKNNQNISVIFKPPVHNHATTIVVQPTVVDYQLAKDLVWFAIHGTSAYNPGDKAYNPPFQQIKIVFPHNGAFTLAYSGNSSGISATKLTVGLKHWTFDKTCGQQGETFITDNSKIYFATTLRCG